MGLGGDRHRHRLAWPVAQQAAPDRRPGDHARPCIAAVGATGRSHGVGGRAPDWCACAERGLPATRNRCVEVHTRRLAAILGDRHLSADTRRWRPGRECDHLSGRGMSAAAGAGCKGCSARARRVAPGRLCGVFGDRIGGARARSVRTPMARAGRSLYRVALRRDRHLVGWTARDNPHRSRLSG